MKKILLIECNPNIENNLEEILNLNDFEVIKTADPYNFFNLALSSNFDLILCDANNSETSFNKIFNDLKKNTKTAKIPFIFIITKEDLLNKKEMFESGLYDFITKPFDQNTLIAKIKNKISKREILEKELKSITSKNSRNTDELLFTVAHKLRSPIVCSKGLIYILNDSDKYKLKDEDFVKSLLHLKNSIDEIDKLSTELSMALNNIKTSQIDD